MKFLKLTDDERSAKRSFQSLTVDNSGNEVYTGLSRDESEWMLTYERKYAPGRSAPPQRDEKEKHIELNKKHEIARLAAVALSAVEPRGSA